MNIKKHIPNLITLSNLFCGILAVKLGFESEFLLAGGLIILGAIFDFFDGFAARLLKVSNEIGKELDSLADMVTFGFAPGVIMFSLLKGLISNVYDLDSVLLYQLPSSFLALIPYFAFLIPLLSAVRLARFNVDENQSDKFIGLPTPANSLFFITIPLIFSEYEDVPAQLIWGILVVILIFSLLLNAKIELLALKFKTFGWKNNEFRYSFILASFIILITCILIKIIYFSIPIIVILYLIISIFNNYILKHK